MDVKQIAYTFECLTIKNTLIFAAIAACKLAAMDYKVKVLPNGDYTLYWQVPSDCEDESCLRCILENLAA